MTESRCHDCRATVVITTHDRPELARRALASALAQTLADVEVLIVDDGSQPAFDAGVEDARVRVVRNDEARGVSAARNVGIREACGEWITFLDDDDELVPDMLERSIDAAETSQLPGPVAAMSGVVILAVDGTESSTVVPAPALVRGEDFFLEGRGGAGRACNSIVAPTDVMRRIGGFDEHLVTFQHDDLGLRLNEAASIVGIADPLYRMTTHPAARLSARWAAIPPDMERTLAKHPGAFARHPRAHAHFMGALAVYHLKAGSWSPAIGAALVAVRLDPTTPRRWLFLGAAVAGPRALRAARRVRPAGISVSTAELARRRARKYGRRLANHPRAVVGDALAPVTRALLRRGAALDAVPTRRDVLLLCVYRARNAAHVVPLVAEASRRGWEARLWALDAVDPSLAPETVGVGSGAKFPLLNALLDGSVDTFDWIVVADDDVELVSGTLDDLLAVGEAAGLDLVQPAQHERNQRDNEIAVRRPLSVARRTTFVEIGPMFAVRRPLAARVVPFPAEHTMGWGLELDWFGLAQEGAALGIVDAQPVRHREPVGRDYSKREQADRLRALLRQRGLESFRDAQRTLGTWRPWQSRPPWALQ